MLRELTIKNYKSILDHTIELGRINVFIGENGCGKTNILEALAMAAATLTNKLSVEELFNRGMRVAKPALMRTSFDGSKSKELSFGLGLESEHFSEHREIELRIAASESASPNVPWFELEDPLGSDFRARMGEKIGRLLANLPRSSIGYGEMSRQFVESLSPALIPDQAKRVVQEMAKEFVRVELLTVLADYGVYEANSMMLRGLTTMSRRPPLGLYGETLDVAIVQLNPEVGKDLLARARCISWLDKFVADPTDAKKYQNHKLGKSQSTLYFHDKHMRRGNNVFSAENVNEGILHVLFHLTLFMSDATPKVLGIDNIETSLNPQLCRDLMAQLPELAAKHGKQALITTHNPAILDGLNLHDDEQRLFVVSRDDDGHTRTRRIKLKPKSKGGKQYKLSELWMRGQIGGLPEKF